MLYIGILIGIAFTLITTHFYYGSIIITLEYKIRALNIHIEKLKRKELR